MRLHQFHLSSASHRVRIALDLKAQPYESLPVDLRGAGQFAPEFARLNPAQLVPALEHEGESLSHSLAIFEYLDERFPEPPLLAALEPFQPVHPTAQPEAKLHLAPP